MAESTEGGCLCGAVRYRVSGAPLARTLCHCRSCRLASGGTNVAWVVFAAGGMEMVKGAVREYSSSPGIYWGSCGACGSLIVYRCDARPDHRDITTATLDDPDAFPPTVEIWTEDMIGWETLDPNLPHHARSSTGG